MKAKKLILWATWAGILAGFVYLSQSQEFKQEGVKVLVSDTSIKTGAIISPFWDTWLYGTSWMISSSTNTRTIKDFLQSYPELKVRIQWMSWYRDFLSWIISQDVYRKYIEDAQKIEGILTENPWLLQKIQHEVWWQRYLRWDTNPTDMFVWNMTSLLYLQGFEKKNPEFYARVQQHPLWNRGIQHGENQVVMWQQDLLISVWLRIEQLHTESWLNSELARFWYAEENIFTDDWSEWQWIYGAIDIIRQILSLDSERKEWFYNSEIGKQYLLGKVNWTELEQFLER